MAEVVHRLLKTHLTSVNTPDFPVSDWIHNPDLSAVEGVPSIYWKITGDTITEMDSLEKAAVDNAVLRTWRLHCVEENTTYSLQADANAPLCPTNPGHTVTNLFQQEPFASHKDENGDEQCIFLTAAQGIVVAKVI